MSDMDRFMAKVVVQPDGCWRWTAQITENGYGQFHVRDGDGFRKDYAHRAAYEMFIGPIPTGLHLDHLCRNRACCNPQHLEPVTCRENLLRGTTLQAENASKDACNAGHPFDEANTRVRSNGSRACRTCGARRQAEFRQRSRAV